MEKDLAGIPADITLVRRLSKAGLLQGPALEAAYERTSHPRLWWAFTNRLLLLLGSGLVLAGVVFFFAYNWASMHRLLKLALVQGGIVACISGALIVGPNRLAGKTLVLSASVLMGVLLAVFGQVYQTGADSWQLFATWAGLIFAWVLFAEFAGLWIVWILVANVAFILFWDSAFPRYGAPQKHYLLSVLSLINLALLIARETYYSWKKPRWLERRWSRWVLLAASLGPVAVYITNYLIDAHQGSSLTILAAWGVWGCGAVLSYLYFRYRQPDLACLFLVLLSGCIISCGLAFSVLDNWLHVSTEEIFFLGMGLATAAIFTVAVTWLRRTSKLLKGGVHG